MAFYRLQTLKKEVQKLKNDLDELIREGVKNDHDRFRAKQWPEGLKLAPDGNVELEREDLWWNAPPPWDMYLTCRTGHQGHAGRDDHTSGKNSCIQALGVHATQRATI